MSVEKSVNVAVIGLGMGRGHLDAFSKYHKANAVAICDSDPARLEQIGKQYGIPAQQCFTNYKDMLRASKALNLQAVSVVLPNSLHAPVTLDCFAAGLHVLCEKPMAMNARQAKAMLDAAKKARKRLMINFSFKFREPSQALKRYVASGAIGDVYFGKTWWHRRRGIPGFGGWFGQKELAGGGPIIDLGVHRLNLAWWLMGNPRPVSVSGAVYNHIGSRLAKGKGKAFDVEDLGAAMIRFDNGATLMVEASWAGYSEKREDMVTQLWGTKGGCLQRNIAEGYDFEGIVYSEAAGALWAGKCQQSTDGEKNAYMEFVDCILEDRESCAPGEHGYQVQLMLDAIYKSARLGREVRITQ